MTPSSTSRSLWRSVSSVARSSRQGPAVIVPCYAESMTWRERSLGLPAGPRQGAPATPPELRYDLADSLTWRVGPDNGSAAARTAISQGDNRAAAGLQGIDQGIGQGVQRALCAVGTTRLDDVAHLQGVPHVRHDRKASQRHDDPPVPGRCARRSGRRPSPAPGGDTMARYRNGARTIAS